MAQTLQFVNGEWVSRTVDVYSAIARAQQGEPTTVAAPSPPAAPPREIARVGILTRTIHETPFVKFALPAHIRQRKLNDVVFVCENAIHLKEVHVDGTLHHVGTKSDFKGKILAARVFGAPRRREEKDQTHRPRMRRKDVHAQRRSTAGEDGAANSLPPEIIVLSLDTNTIMFLWAHQAPTEISFRHQTLRLPPGTSPYDRPGSFLAVDPNCRAIAVAALEGHFILYSTKSIDDWREDIRQQGDGTVQATLVEDERVIPIHGRIMHMEFLAPNRGQQQPDDTHVILVLFVAHNGRTKITCYDWDTRYNLSTAKPRAERVIADWEDDNPSLLIPLARRSDFLVVCDRHVAMYTNILSGTHNRLESPVPKITLPMLRPGDSKSYPRWVQWSRATRNDSYPKEAFYIAREDGRVLYVEIGTAFTHPSPYDAGKLPHSVDKAFACLDIDTGSLNSVQPDVLVSAGVDSDGSVSKVGSFVLDGLGTPYQDVFNVSVVEPIPSWTPLNDMTIAKLPGAQRESILTASGRAPHGCIAELRRGIQARVDGCVGGLAGSTNMWILHRGVEEARDQSHMQYHAIVLVNMPPESLVFRVTRAKRAWHGWEQITGDDSTAVLRDETISASMINDTRTVQITRSEARTLSRPALTLVDSISFDAPILAAASRSHIQFIAVTYKDKATNHPTLHIFKVDQNGIFTSADKTELPAEPTCVELLDTNAVFVSFPDATIRIYKVDAAGEKLFSGNVLDLSTPLTGVCESASLLKFRNQITILCGTRDGQLVSISFIEPNDHLTLETSIRRMGSTPVRVLRSATDASVAFVSCGKEFCRVHHHIGPSHPVIDSVWFTDREDPCFQQDAITAVDQFPRSDQSEDLDQNLTGYFFAISGDRFLIAQLDYERGPQSFSLQRNKAVPRTYQTKTTPVTLLYSEYLRKLIVHTFEPVEKRQPPNGYRTIKSSINVIEPDAERRPDTHGETVATFYLENYERVHSMVEWVSEKDGKRYHFLLVGTNAMKDNGTTYGRLLFLQIGTSGIMSRKSPKEFDSPVLCMALSPSTKNEKAALFYVTGTRLLMDEFDNEKSKWTSRGQLLLPSRATHISVSPRDSSASAPRIHVSTTEHSHLCFEVDRQSSGVAVFKRLFTDSRARNLTQHLTIPLDPVVHGLTEISILADKTCGISGIVTHPAADTLSPNARTTFEAHLPRSITRLQRGDIMPPWRVYTNGWSRQKPAGILADDIIASCSDGTVYALALLSEPALRTLKILQNLIKYKEARVNQSSIILRPDSGTQNRFSNILHASPSPNSTSSSSPPHPRCEVIELRDVDPGERSQTVPKKCHVDADVLHRYFDGHVSAGELERLVMTDTNGLPIMDLLKRLFGLGRPVYGTEDALWSDLAAWVNSVIRDVL